MSFLGVKVILFLVIPLIIKEKSNASALKLSNKLSHIDRYEHGERSMLVFISTVMNMWNGRCGMTFSLLLPDFLTAFARFFHCFRPIFSMLLPD